MSINVILKYRYALNRTVTERLQFVSERNQSNVRSQVISVHQEDCSIHEVHTRQNYVICSQRHQSKQIRPYIAVVFN